MSLDAQDWVWEHSRSKGTARLVLLAIADKASGSECSAYAGTTFLVKRANAARSSVVEAVDKLIGLGELAIITGRWGPRGETCYRLPKAVGHRRSGGPESGPPRGTKSGPVQNPDRSEIRTGGPVPVPPGGTDSVPGGSGFRTGGVRIPDPRTHINASTSRPVVDDSDDAIDTAITTLLAQLTGQQITPDWATAVRHRILDGHTIRVSRLGYVMSALRDNPRKFTPPNRTGPPPLKPAARPPSLPPKCGACNPFRRLEDETGRDIGPCPTCATPAHTDPPESRREHA